MSVFYRILRGFVRKIENTYPTRRPGRNPEIGRLMETVNRIVGPHPLTQGSGS